MIREATVVQITDDLLRRIDVNRYADGKGGFQRKLDAKKVSGVLEIVGAGSTVPPILIAQVDDGALLCIDGQHRLEARRKMDFPLFAQISEMTKREAAREFIIHNSRAAKVTRKHRMTVDPGAYATSVRGLANKFNADVTQVESVLKGVTSGRARYMKARKSEFDLADEVLEHWTKDKRWTDVTPRGGNRNTYATPAVLTMVGALSKDRPEKVAQVAKLLRDLDFSGSGTFGRKCGCGNSDQSEMKKYALTFMFRKGFGDK